VEFSGIDLRFSEVIFFSHQGLAAKSAAVGGMDDAPALSMALHPVELRLAGVNGRTAAFRYGLSETQGWDLRADLDDRVIAVRHCRNWRGMERLYEWLRAMLQLRGSPCQLIPTTGGG
jgi:hypothetical protein